MGSFSKIAIGFGVTFIGGAVIYYLFLRNSKKELYALTNPEIAVPFKLVDKEIISHDTCEFKFALPTPKHRLGLPIGQHLYISTRINGTLVERPYTPMSDNELVGYVYLLYKRFINSKFPQGGTMSNYLDSLKIGDYVYFKGPSGLITYNGKGEFSIRPEKMADPVKKHVKTIVMIAGGTGITPMFQMIQFVLKHSDVDHTKLFLIYANKTEEDILLRDQLERLRDDYPDQFKLWYTVDYTDSSSWKYSVGFVDANMITEHIPPPGENMIILTCGPVPMMQLSVNPALDKLGYAQHNRFSY